VLSETPQSAKPNVHTPLAAITLLGEEPKKGCLSIGHGVLRLAAEIILGLAGIKGLPARVDLDIGGLGVFRTAISRQKARLLNAYSVRSATIG
jgi:hypothetical protein